MSPLAIARQNRRSTSRRSDGFPGDFIGARPVNVFIHPAGLPIGTSTLEVLQRPVEFTQYLSIRYTATLSAAGVNCSAGTVGDSYDNALAETVIGLYKTELVRRHGPWRNLEHLELATLDWYNHRRLHSWCGNIPPVEYEASYYNQHQGPGPEAGMQES